jgi:hypothetical protein
LAVTVGKIGYNAAKYAAHYVATHGLRGAVRNLYAGGKSLAGKAWDWMKRKQEVGLLKGCGCFTAGTLVWSAMGPMPIEEIKKHDWVYAQNVETGELELREVTDVIVTPNTAGLDVVVSHIDGEAETISTTDEHPFWIETDSCRGAKGEWKRADTLREGDAVRTLKGVAIIERVLFGTRRETVYNFTVEGLNNYRVGLNGLLVHNCWAGYHHLVPRYLGQGESYTTYGKMTHADHVELHSYIDEAGAVFGMPKRHQGAAAVERWLKQDASNIHAMHAALQQAYFRFDLKHGSSLGAEFETAWKVLAP